MELHKEQIELENVFAKNHLKDRVKQYFIDEGANEVIDSLFDQEDHRKFAMRLLVNMAIHKRGSLDTVVGLMRHSCEKIQEVMDLLMKCIEVKLVSYKEQTGEFITNFTVSGEVQRELDMFQYPLPMVCKPQVMKKNTDTGYLTIGGSVLLNNRHHDLDVCLDFINLQNSIKMKINTEVASVVSMVPPKRAEGETKQEFSKRERSFVKFKDTTTKVMGFLNESVPHFYQVHGYDHRGRSYVKGYHINHQGMDYNKAVIEFAEEELINE